jgi:hypothetical protein
VLELTLLRSKSNVVSFKTTDRYLTIIGKFLVKDAAYKSDFIRAVIVSPCDEEITLDICVIKTDAKSVHVTMANTGTLTVSKTQMIDILNGWEEFMMNKLAEKTLTCAQDEFTLYSALPATEPTFSLHE